MKERQLQDILASPIDYKVCKSCGSINWYENEECITCGAGQFHTQKEAVLKWTEDEYKYWMEENGYSEQEADRIFIEV